ncbi:MAG: hypothetical protein DMF82_20255 [Acidobacteria bacterium]|nr:MAG: hypothetical protein DMF82_20255 [Acidobacteriota bacterium]
MHAGAEDAHFTELAREVWSRRKWLAVIVFTLVAAAGVTLVWSLPDLYRATATVLVEDSRVDASVVAELDRRLQMISQEILSRARLDAIIRRFGLYPELRPISPEAAVAQMRRDIGTRFQAWSGAGSAGGTMVIAVSYRGTNAATVTHVTNAIAGLYLEEDRKIRERQASGNVQMLGSQLQEMRQTIDAQQSEANLAAMEQFHAELRTTSEERMRALDRRNDLLRRLSELDGADAVPAAVSPRANRLAKLKEELADLQRRFSDRYPDVVRVKAEIAELESQPAAETAVPTVNDTASGRTAAHLKDALAEVERQIESFKADEARLRSIIAGYVQRLENAPQHQRDLQEISRDHQTTRDVYDALRKRYEQAQLEENAESGNAGPRFRILDAAMVPSFPAAPNRLLLLFFTLIAALGSAVGAAMVLERLDTSFKSADDVRAFTAVPLLASIPRMVTESDVRSRRLRFLMAAVSVLVAIGVLVGASHHMARGNEALVSLLDRGRS